ncbi:MAG TPA: GDSL-type esterase/lipase family protein [Thermodesulfovibrionales bacterium]|nr:GDSL-type esterase/lipase family protein [Thermodesulfovibrionales bacterium]
MDILFIGHSLIEFFDWQRRFPAHRTANLGVAGETVEGLLSRVDAIVRKHPSADFIFIMTGLNNIVMDDFNFSGSYAMVLSKLSAAYPSARILLNSVLPTMSEFIANSSILDVNGSLKSLAKERDVGFLDIYRLFVDKEGRPLKDLFLDDGVHLSDKGYAVWSGALEDAISR